MPHRHAHTTRGRLSTFVKTHGALTLALLASIPAFYDSLMPAPGAWAQVLYGLSGALVLGSVWLHGRRHHPRALGSSTQSWTSWQSSQKGDALLGLALLACALLPASSTSVPALAARLLLALVTLLRLVVVSKPLFEHAGLVRLLAMSGGVLGLCGVGFYLIDPDVHGLGDGLWLAFSTAATVGYGDLVPSTTASRIFSVFVVLLGYGVLSLVTASIAAMFVGSQERKVEREILRDMHAELGAVKQEIAQLRAELQDTRDARGASSARPGASQPLDRHD